MCERLERAAVRLREPGQSYLSDAFCLRADQAKVFERFIEYLTSRSCAPVLGQPAAFCRIVLPPRTGKSVLAVEIIGRSGLTATIIVPTRTLIQQTRRLLGEMLPRTPVGVLSGEERSVVTNGVNLTTYSMLHRLGAEAIPAPLRQAALVFVDEAHRAMSRPRMALLRDTFDREALRVALTATPDYDAERRLCHVFPDLIHEVSLGEALELRLLAPVRVWVAEVDNTGSAVKLVAGDYDRETLGRLMSAAPFFKATQLFRYAPGNKAKAALLCCSTRQQAYDLAQYLEAHRPPGTPAPALLLGETPREEREGALARFEAGEIDTLIQVGS
jgi:superfamily II DNA or RNA helicase